MVEESPALREMLMDAIVAAHCTDPPAVYGVIMEDMRYRGRSMSHLESLLGSFDRRWGARAVGRLVMGHTASAARRVAARHNNWQRRRELMLVFLRSGQGGDDSGVVGLMLLSGMTPETDVVRLVFEFL